VTQIRRCEVRSVMVKISFINRRHAKGSLHNEVMLEGGWVSGSHENMTKHEGVGECG